LPASRTTWLSLAIVVVIGIAAAVTLGDARHLGDRLDDFAWWSVVASAALALGNYTIRWLRWQMYLRDQKITVPRVSSIVVFGAGLSLSITPAKIGELVKAYLLREMHGIPATQTAPIVIAERVSDLVALLVLAVIGVAMYGVATGLVVAGGAVITFGLVLLAWPRPTRWLIDFATRPQSLRKLRVPLHETYEGLAALCRPKMLLAATAIAVPAWGCECVGFALIVNGFPGAHVGLGLAMVIYASTTIAGALSFLPGGLGVTEGAMTVLLVEGATHLDSPTALDATLLTRITTLWFAVGIGIVFLAIARARIAARPR
jgi:glycosyltransferase 2 family protein